MIADSNARRVIDDIVARLKKEYRPEKIILFGSYAYGKPTRDSDIDLFIIKKTAESPLIAASLFVAFATRPIITFRFNR